MTTNLKILPLDLSQAGACFYATSVHWLAHLLPLQIKGFYTIWKFGGVDEGSCYKRREGYHSIEHLGVEKFCVAFLIKAVEERGVSENNFEEEQDASTQPEILARFIGGVTHSLIHAGHATASRAWLKDRPHPKYLHSVNYVGGDFSYGGPLNLKLPQLCTR
ncbi:hypothetical protein C8R48DRAFT_673628 [Suillus tomentosus]|nr:hypothetical protein C8R48DRAFT_673628 [Suillus tomentosus]